MAKYQKYAEYKDSGIEWLGEIPSHWTFTSLKRFSFVKGGYAFSSDIFTSVGKPIIRIGDIQADGSISLDNCKNIPLSVAENSQDYLVTKGQILMAMTGATIGKAGIFDSDEVAYLNQRVGKFIIDSNALDYGYLWYLLKTHGYQEYIRLTAFGGAQPNISDNAMVDFNTCIPSLSEQVAIANFLDHETAKIDSLIAKQEKLIELLKEKRQAVISNLVAVQKHEPTIKLKYAVEILAGYSFSSTGFRTESDNGIPLLRGINVGVGNIKWEECVWWSKSDTNGLERYLLQEGDLVFGMDRPWISSGARVAEIQQSDLPSYLVQRVARIRCIDGFYQPYVKLVLSSKEFKSFIESDLTGVSVPHISTDQIISFEIRNLPYEQQVAETDKVICFMYQVEKLINKAESAIQLIQERRTALISSAVTGKINVTNWQNPNPNNNEANTELGA